MDAAQLKYGVEIECYIPSEHRRDFAPGGYHNGRQIRIAPDGWNAQSDGSLSGGRPGFTPVEVVSPPLMGERGLEELVYLVDYLEGIGTDVDRYCGLHVHVDARQLESSHLDRLLKNYKRYEKAFYGLSAEQAQDRWNNSYCLNSRRWESQNSRYNGLNLSNYHYQAVDKMTVEFRVWASKLDAYTLVTAVCMATAIVGRAHDGGTVPRLTPLDAPVESATEFAGRHWNQRKYRIVPDADQSDLSRTLLAACERAAI